MQNIETLLHPSYMMFMLQDVTPGVNSEALLLFKMKDRPTWLAKCQLVGDASN